MSRWVDPGADVQAWLGPAWAAIQTENDEVPDCAFVPAHRGTADRGFAAVAPPGYARPDGSRITELTVMAFPGLLNCYAAKAFEILMHEAVHTVDYARNGDVSGHKQEFANIARELGLMPISDKRDSGIKYDVRLAESLRLHYGDAIINLSNAWTELGVQRWVIG